MKLIKSAIQGFVVCGASVVFGVPGLIVGVLIACAIE